MAKKMTLAGRSRYDSSMTSGLLKDGRGEERENERERKRDGGGVRERERGRGRRRDGKFYIHVHCTLQGGTHFDVVISI